MKKSGSFENYDRQEKVKMSSNRSFGFVFSLFFLILFGSSFYKHSDWLYLWAALAVFAFMIAVLAPAILEPLNKLWTRFGLLLHKLTTPLIMGLMFFAVFLPLGLVLRFFKRLSLNKAFDSSLKTYWIDRTPAGPLPKTMKDSF